MLVFYKIFANFWWEFLELSQQQKSYTESVELMYNSSRPSSTGGTDVSSKCQMTPYNCTKHNDCVLLIRAANNQEQQYHQTVLPSLLEVSDLLFEHDTSVHQRIFYLVTFAFLAWGMERLCTQLLYQKQVLVFQSDNDTYLSTWK